MVASFHEIQFPADISVGAVGGPEFKTTILTLGSGEEKRNIEWSLTRFQGNIGTGLRERDDFEVFQAFFYARYGRAYGFRFKDWSDYTIEGQSFEVGGGIVEMTDTNTKFQLYKEYASGGFTFLRPILKPVNATADGTRVIKVNGVAAPEGTGGTIGAGSAAVAGAGGSIANPYSVGDVLTVLGITGTAPTLTVTHISVVAIDPVPVAGGTTAAGNGSYTIQGTTGTGAKFTATATVAGGTVTAVGPIVTAGDYTANLTAIANEPVVGLAGLSDLAGAAVSVGTGVLAATVLTAGTVSDRGSNPHATSVAPAGGTGATLTVAWTGFRYAIDYTTGILTFNAGLLDGEEVEVTYLEFDIPVRFDIDKLDMNMAAYEAGEWVNIPILELKNGN